MDNIFGVGGAQKGIQKKKNKKHHRTQEASALKEQEDLAFALKKVKLPATSSEQEKPRSPQDSIKNIQLPSIVPSNKEKEDLKPSQQHKQCHIPPTDELEEEELEEDVGPQEGIPYWGPTFGPKRETREMAVQCNLGQIFTLPVSRGRVSTYCNPLRFN